MLIDFSLHSLLKIEILKSHGIDVSKEIVENIVMSPDRIEDGYKHRSIAQKSFDETRVIPDYAIEKSNTPFVLSLSKHERRGE